jgi:glycosyltransferase involved in cell wall biosynthesis
MKRLVVVGHPSVVPANQAVYAELGGDGWDPVLVVPDRWPDQYGGGTLRPSPLPELEGRLILLRVAFAGRQQRHAYLVRPSRILRALRPEAVFVEAEPFSIPALQWGAAAVRLGIPFGVQADENLDRPLPLTARWIRSLVLPRASFVAARSPTAAALVRRFGARGRVGVVPHAVPPLPKAARPQQNGFTVGFAGRLVPQKGVLDLVEAAAALGDADLLLVGDGPLRGRLEGRRRTEVVVGTAHGAMASAYARMDVLVLPSRTTRTWAEQFGRVLVEALSCGVPVIGSDAGEIPWVIGVTGGGLVVPEGDVEALAAALRRLRDRPQERALLAQRGRAAAERLFSARACAETLRDLLEEAA